MTGRPEKKGRWVCLRGKAKKEKAAEKKAPEKLKKKKRARQIKEREKRGGKKRFQTHGPAKDGSLGNVAKEGKKNDGFPLPP